MRQITLTVRPEARFPVPISDGYSVYSSLLSALDSVDDAVSERIHDSELGSLHCSGLLGNFGHSDRSHHKSVHADRTYELTLGVVDPGDEEIFQALVQALVFDDDELELTNGTLRVESFESTNTTHEELLARANDYDDPTIEIEFRTPTCIEEAGDVTTMFPTRTAVFQSLLGKWNRTAPSDYEFDLSHDDLASSIIEKPDARSYQTHSVLVNRITNDDGETRPLFRQGFTGNCEYDFKGASESLRNAVTALAVFARYSGVGSAVARGCGAVNVEVKE
ncbi:CRISPR system precrRNA processing endoribonuclease RAMP protein Cas6 [Halorussus halophilus]|uniref:CRISPR system precrRNA processing endoribonuclease RAMP protein Cas6 n=1 Tax=Halorussus halophilus TaxID=2650975 RepID=UPI0013016C01|nr:CRISPR system precrRNA processing endoribonuclease RAMP protein Cas6 [Halorussus halophilus]